jgi:8-oxo-dGTP pyrophosphatase MutT (NUDIX family)
MDAYTIAFDCARALPRAAVDVRLRSSHGRRIDPDLETSILAEWAAQLRAHPRMFNGRKFRYGSVAATECGDRVRFDLGLTDYRSMVGTNSSARWSELERHDPSLLANPVGNSAIVETSDGCVVLLQRSKTLLEAPGLWVFPGGHAEPKAVGIEGWGTAELAAHDQRRADAGDAVGTDVERRIGTELFASIRREVVEEIGVAESELCGDEAPEQLFLGVVKRTEGARYNTAFVMRCARSSDEILARYATPGAAVDAYESTSIVAIPIASLEARAAKLAMPGCHRGVLELYARHVAARRAAGAPYYCRS